MFTKFLHALSTHFCLHEWTRRRDGRRIYLECVNCLATTPGIEISAGEGRIAHGQRRFETAQAA